MKSEGTQGWSRRDFVRGLTLGGTAGLIGFRPGAAHADPAPETTKLTLFEYFGPGAACIAPQFVAEALLYGEGFTDVHYLKNSTEAKFWFYDDLLSGRIDIALSFLPTDIMHIEAGAPLVNLAGSHIGCTQLVTDNRIRSVRELKGKAVGVYELRGVEQVFISLWAAYAGVEAQEINWVIVPLKERERLFGEGKLDAIMTQFSGSKELVAKNIGHVLLDTTFDKPWSDYFCCMVSSNREFVRKHPVATKRALRALLKAADICGLEPERAARLTADRTGTRYDDTLQQLKDTPYGSWREYSPEDSVRFHALLMREAGLIKSSPQKIIADGTDWRFLEELKRELKA